METTNREAERPKSREYRYPPGCEPDGTSMISYTSYRVLQNCSELEVVDQELEIMIC